MGQAGLRWRKSHLRLGKFDQKKTVLFSLKKHPEYYLNLIFGNKSLISTRHNGLQLKIRNVSRVLCCFLLVEFIFMFVWYFAGYVVEKRSRGGDWVPVNSFPVKDTNFTVMGLQEGTVVEFRVAAVNDGGPGKFSKATPPHQVRDQVCKQISDTIYSILIVRNVF